jgi:hypothetical protein
MEVVHVVAALALDLEAPRKLYEGTGVEPSPSMPADANVLRQPLHGRTGTHDGEHSRSTCNGPAPCQLDRLGPRAVLHVCGASAPLTADPA